MSKETPFKRGSVNDQHETPHFKAGRVKVAVRIRPPFQDEVSAAKNGQYVAVVDARMEQSIDDLPIGGIEPNFIEKLNFIL